MTPTHVVAYKAGWFARHLTPSSVFGVMEHAIHNDRRRHDAQDVGRIEVRPMDWIKERLAVVTPQTGALLIAMFAQVTVALTSVLDDHGLLGWLFIGCVFGAFVKTAIAPPQLATQRRNLQQLSAEFAASMFCGVAIGAGVIWGCGLELNSAVSISVGFTFSCIGIGIVHKAGPLVERWSIQRFTRDAGKYFSLEAEAATQPQDVDAKVAAVLVGRDAHKAADAIGQRMHDAAVVVTDAATVDAVKKGDSSITKKKQTPGTSIFDSDTHK